MRNPLFILAISFALPCLAQDYKPLLDTYNEWQFTYCDSDCYTDMYRTAGDTVVGGKNYKVLDGYHFISRTFLLREDVASRKVYLNFVQPSGNNEYLLYDFSLNVGDSIAIKNPISPFPEDGGYYKVEEITNEPLVDGNEYRHFYLSPTPSNTISDTPAVWIEGVGSLSLINAPGGFPNINDVGHLTCFFKNGEPFYAKRETCETLILGISQNDNSLENVLLNTLIKNGQCQISNAENISSVTVYDTNGRKLREIKSNEEKQLNLDFSNVSSGIYFVVVQSNGFEQKVFKVLVK